MDELVARHSEMPVVIAEDGIAVAPDHIYLMPPRKEMIIRDRRLWLTDKEPHTFSLPTDAFFRRGPRTSARSGRELGADLAAGRHGDWTLSRTRVAFW